MVCLRPFRTIAPILVLALAPACAGDDGGTDTQEPGTTGEDTTAGPDATTTGSTTTATDPTTTNPTTDPTTTTTATTTSGVECGEDVEPDGALVPTTHGPIQGTDAGGLYEFLGVPFAAPPVGDLRWRPPEDPVCWAAPLDTTELGPRCVQLEGNQLGDITGVVGEEDCLYLNVWTPETGPAGEVSTRPVMVFIHGGGNAIGYGGDPLYDGADLAMNQDVVVVTVNYRLAALGYLTHDSLAAEDADGVSGNYGIRDQLKALEWVQENIAVFGGDPDLVTVFGESGGAVNTCTLVGSPQAAGLFHRAIVQSGGCGARGKFLYEQQISTPWVDGSGCANDPDPAACLRAIPAADLVELEPNGFPSVAGLGQGFGPHIDGHVLTQTPNDALAAGEANDVPFMVGANDEETALSVPPLTEAAYTALVNATFGLLGMQAVQQILDLYSVQNYGDATSAYIALTSDVKFVCGARTAARAAATGLSSPVYRYHFAYNDYTVGMNMEGHAFHGLELFYIFGNFDALELGPIEYMPNADDLAMKDIMQATWAAFAADGAPDNAELPDPWPVYDAQADPYMLLDVMSAAGDGVRTTECDLWDSLIP